MTGPAARGWGAVAALALLAATLSVVGPALIIFVPLALLLLAAPPRRPALMLLGGALAATTLLFRTDPGALGAATRGWVLILGAWFVVTVVAMPNARFLSRALAALGAAVLSAMLCLLWSRGGWGYLDWSVARHYRGAAADATALWSMVAGPAWTDRLTASIHQAAELQILLHPALLALASLAGLAVAWWAFRRLTVRDPGPFAPFREFRFRDELVWILISGILLVVLPLGDAALRTGSNVLAFMGALYALRGAAVVLAVLGLPGLGSALFGVLALLFLPMVMVASVLVGVTDTWLDLRARQEAARSGS